VNIAKSFALQSEVVFFLSSVHPKMTWVNSWLSAFGGGNYIGPVFVGAKQHNAAVAAFSGLLTHPK